MTRLDPIARARAVVRELTADQLAARLHSPAAPLLLDVREESETDEGILTGAVLLPRGLLELRVEQLVPTTAEVVVYCAGGTRSLLAAHTLHEMGYANVQSLAGGFNAWKSAGQPWHRPEKLTGEQRARYARHLRIPEVGESGQLKLLTARVLIVGAGALGSPAALYLAAAGVGTITIVDDDVVEASNLQRQVVHNTQRLGQPKADSAAETLRSLNPGIRVVPHRIRITHANARALIAGNDLVVDGSDNFATRYLLNDACRLENRPLIYAAIHRFEGQVSTFLPDRGPCYRCLFPAPPPPEFAPSCQEAGVLGVVPGIMGALQASEALKLLLGVGAPLCGRLQTFDALTASFRELKFRPAPGCIACGPVPLTELPMPLAEGCRT